MFDVKQTLRPGRDGFRRGSAGYLAFMVKIRPVTLVLALAAALATLALSATASLAAPNDNAAYLRVVANNTENLPAPGNVAGCKGSWRSLPNYLGRHFIPDVITLQQIDTKPRSGHKSQLNRYLKALEKATGEHYKAIVSTRDPRPMNAQGCDQYKRYQANVILYRTSRLQMIGEKRVVQSLRSPAGGGCTKLNEQERSKIVYAQLQDLGSGGRVVGVASLHWPTATHDKGQRCAAANGRRVRGVIKNLGGTPSLNIIAGDANVGPSRGGAWYSQMRKKAGYVDPVYRGCKGVPACLAANGTIGGANGAAKRIDFIFAQGANNKTKGKSIPFDAVRPGPSNHYSQHRAVKAKVHYTG